jgi:hypothetical protein
VLGRGGGISTGLGRVGRGASVLVGVGGGGASVQALEVSVQVGVGGGGIGANKFDISFPFFLLPPFLPPSPNFLPLGSPNSYNCTFPTMIDDWREKWYIGSQNQTTPLYFGFVQVSGVCGAVKA